MKRKIILTLLVAGSFVIILVMSQTSITSGAGLALVIPNVVRNLGFRREISRKNRSK
jgi:hypothetical protein